MPVTDFATINQMMCKAVIQNITAPHVDRTRKLVGPIGSGYMTGDHYDVHYCADVENTFNAQSGNQLRFPEKWRKNHKGDTLEVFIAEASNEAWDQANPSPPVG
jgi:hypothetical protein